MTEKHLNIAGYKFVVLSDRNALRQPFKQLCDNLGLRGTILLSYEGINIFVAGPEDNINQFRSFLAEDERFADIDFKESYSEHQPFNRMNVRLKNEIISVGMPNFDRTEPEQGRIRPEELHERLNKHQDIVLLDTRNTYETRLGTFQNAIELDIDTFRSFPQAISKLDESLKDKEIVMFCTGGVRCEKASVIMKDAGFSNIKQLEGGILGYFEQVGGDHWDGECFVFDKRVALLPDLSETGTTICFACREPLTTKEQSHPAYVPGESCSYCIERHQSQTIH